MPGYCCRFLSSFRLTLPLLALATVAAAGVSLIPAVTPTLAERAAQRWPDVDAAQLEVGRHFYVKRCSGCHNLHLPSEKAPDEWAEALDEMAVKARLDESQKTAVLRYLTAASAEQRGVSLGPAPAIVPAAAVSAPASEAASPATEAASPTVAAAPVAILAVTPAAAGCAVTPAP